MTDIEMMQVLGEIADDCYYRMHCGGCKFDKKGGCMLKGTPADWDIEKDIDDSRGISLDDFAEALDVLQGKDDESE